MGYERLVDITFEDVKIISEANNTDHWSKKLKRKKIQIMKMYTLKYIINTFNLKQPVVRLTRIAPRCLDDDNLVYAFKYIRDHISDVIYPGYAPGRSDAMGIKFEYAQEKASKRYAVKVEILSVKETDD